VSGPYDVAESAFKSLDIVADPSHSAREEAIEAALSDDFAVELALALHRARLADRERMNEGLAADGPMGVLTVTAVDRLTEALTGRVETIIRVEVADAAEGSA